MSSKSSKKSTPPKTPKINTITTRNKSAQQNRQLRTKNKKNEKPPAKQTNTKTVTKSTKDVINETCRKDTPLKTKVRNLVKLVEQVEYYPELLKRDFSNKKVMLKPKHNFKVIATANKRKLSVPQKGGGIKPPPPLIRLRPGSKSVKAKCPNSGLQEMSMVDMVRLIEETQSLSDEDFMEILTCPSPVWWEDPPDDEYIEDAICTRSEDSSSVKTSTKNDNRIKEQNNKTNKSKNKSKSKTKDKEVLVDFENEIEQFKITSTNKNNKSEKFNTKKQKLENILGNIKNVKHNKEVPTKKEVNNRSNNRKRKISNSTDGEEFSDISFNEEEVLKNLENMVIPIEQSKVAEQNDTETDNNTKNKNKNRKDTDIEPNTVIQNKLRTIKTELIEPENLPTLTRKPEFINNKVNSENSDSNSEFYVDSVSQSNFRFISDDDVSLDDCSDGNNKVFLVDKSSFNESSPTLDIDRIDSNAYDKKKEHIDYNNTGNINNKKALCRKKVVTDLSEYITVYKIVAQDDKNDTNNESLTISPKNESNKNGQLNNFFKKRKNNKRLKTCDNSIPAPVTNVTNLKENSDVDTEADDITNRLKPCDHSVVKNGTNNFYCEKCDTSLLVCKMCNISADSKEMLAKHMVSCRYRSRLSSNLNTTEAGFGID